MTSKIAIVATTWWPLGARLAVAMNGLGVHVGAICPRGSPLTKVSGVHELFRYSALTPKHSLAVALQAMRPDLIVVCDDRAVEDLHALHASEFADEEIRRLIVRSFGDPAGYADACSRGALVELAKQEGIPVPPSRALRSEADVRDWWADRTMPAVLKADGSWGGAGVTLVDSLETALAAFRRMSRPLATWRAAKFLLSNRDPFPLGGWLRRERRPIIGQSFIQGQIATTMAACWEGNVVAASSVLVRETAKQFGAATIIQPLTHPALALATMRLVRRLGMSGFCGLDFLIEHRTGTAYLIELNPRATQLGHLALEGGGTLASAMLDRLRGEDAPAVAFSPIVHRTMAFFPQAWLSRPASLLLPEAYHDIPWEDPGLVAELLRRPWELRSPLARLTDITFRKIDPARLSATSARQLRDTPDVLPHPAGGPSNSAMMRTPVSEPHLADPCSPFEI